MIWDFMFCWKLRVSHDHFTFYFWYDLVINLEFLGLEVALFGLNLLLDKEIMDIFIFILYVFELGVFC